jgi:hypothetical protein
MMEFSLAFGNSQLYVTSGGGQRNEVQLSGVGIELDKILTAAPHMSPMLGNALFQYKSPSEDSPK